MSASTSTIEANGESKRSSTGVVDQTVGGGKRQCLTALAAIGELTRIVADSGDTGDYASIRPTDATTNPSLILQAATKGSSKPLIDAAIAKAVAGVPDLTEKAIPGVINSICTELLIAFAKNILEVIPGRVSVEVDPALSFDVEGTVTQARALVKAFEAAGVTKDRLLIKIGATWEGCQAASVLESEGISCNMTLIFSLAQAIAAADAKAFLISPFVGRILDWHKKSSGNAFEDSSVDPGVLSVKSIYYYFKKFGYATQVMGASFRNTGEILELAGCDLLTISPTLLKQLEAMPASAVSRRLDPAKATKECETAEKLEMTESNFRWMLNQCPMATEKLAEGIRNFHKDWQKLRAFLEVEMQSIMNARNAERKVQELESAEAKPTVAAGATSKASGNENVAVEN